jgi:putative ABC transport system permease protein
MTIDPTVVMFAFVVAILAGVLCSLPAILHLSSRAACGNLEESLRERWPVSSQHSSGLFRGSLVVSELALALVLLIGAGLMVGTFHRLLDLNQGFDPKNLLTAQVSLPQPAYADSARRLAYYDHALEALTQLPGVSSVGLVAHLGDPAYFAIEGRPEHRSGEPLPDIAPASSGYLDSMRIPLLAGRAISAADTLAAPRTVVLSKTFAHFYWPTNASPLGQRIKLEQGGPWLTVVGVCADVIDDWFSGKPASRAYVSYAQAVPKSAEFLLRTAQGGPLALAPLVRVRLQSLDPAVPLLDLNSMEQALRDERAGVRAAASTMSSYAAIALLLAITGIYGVVSYLVSMSTRDIGVHMALGATRAHVLKMMTRQTGRLIVAGVAGGLLLSVLLTRLMAHLLFDVVQRDAPLWFALTFVLLAAAFLAAYLPALRATKIDPISALRHD